MQGILIPADERRPVTVVELDDLEQARVVLGADCVHSVPFRGRPDVVPLYDADSAGPVNIRATFLVAADPILGPCVLIGVNQVAGHQDCPIDLVERLTR